MSLFIPECNCFISLIVKYHIKILCAPFIKVLESSGVLFWVFFVFSRALHVPLRLVPSGSDRRRELVLLGESGGFPALLAGVASPRHPFTRRGFVFRGDAPSQTGPVCLKDELIGRQICFPLRESEINTSGLSRHLVQEKVVCHQQQR